jgi:Uma2 family endonuclease
LPEEHDEVGTSWNIAWLIRTLLLTLESLGEEDHRGWFVGWEQDMLLRADDLRVGVRPDGYILPAIPKERNFERWPAYDPNVPAPLFAFELVSESNWEKDYQDAPEKYTALGVNELMLVDPMAAEGKSPANPAYVFQLYRKGKGARLERVYAGPGPVFSEETGVWWRWEEGSVVLSRDKEGRERVLTREEKNQREVEAERSARRAAEERERQAQTQAVKTAREAIVDLCELLGLELTSERRAELDSLDLEGLRTLRATLKTRKAWSGASSG